MKKLIFAPLCFVVIFLSACDLLMSDRKMLDYYSDDSNYKELTGIVKNQNIVGRDDNGRLLEIDVIIDKEGFFNASVPIEGCVFELYGLQDIYNSIFVGDTITFISAPMIFYNGHTPPIVYLEKDGEVLLTFEEGKEAYINWIKTN